MRVTRDAVIQAAEELADQRGLNQVSLKAVAERLGLRAPSLYNHITGLDDLLREVAHRGMNSMNDQMAQAAVGISGDAAIQAAGSAYFRFIIAHPGVYETIQWAVWHGNEETAAIFGRYRSLLTRIILSCRLNIREPDEILNLLMGVLHGYSTLRVSAALKNPEQELEGLGRAIDTVLSGIHKEYD